MSLGAESGGGKKDYSQNLGRAEQMYKMGEGHGGLQTFTVQHGGLNGMEKKRGPKYREGKRGGSGGTRWFGFGITIQII